MITRLLAGLVVGGAGAFLGVLFSLSSGCSQSTSPEEAPVAAETNKPEEAPTGPKSKQEVVIHVNDEADFKKHVLEAKLPCLADFFSDSCPPCRMLAPTIKTLADRYKGKAAVCKVSLDHAETRELARQYRIMGIPAVLFFENGQETQRLVGLRSEEEYARVLDKMIKARD